MKIRHIVCLSIAIVVPQLAPAKVPMAAQTLGQIESILDFCTTANPRDASNYKALKNVLTGSASEKELADARKKQEYKNSYQAESEELAKQPKEKAVKACSSFFESAK